MNLTATLIVQAIVFVILALVTMKYIWPPLIRAIDDRRNKTAGGLAAAERGFKELQSANGEAQIIVNEAREKALKIVDQANRRSGEIVEEARSTAVAEGQRLVGDARQEAALAQTRARDQLRKEVASLAVAGASRLLEREIDPKAHADLIEQPARAIETARGRGGTEAHRWPNEQPLHDPTPGRPSPTQGTTPGSANGPPGSGGH